MEGNNTNKVIIIISLLSIFTGIIVLCGWAFHINLLVTFFPGMLRMTQNAAICFVALGISLLITQFKPNKYSNAVSVLLLLLVTAIGVLTILQYLFRANTTISGFLTGDNVYTSGTSPSPGRMALNTAVSFFILSVSLLGLTSKETKLYNICQSLLSVVTIITAAVLIGYIYGAATMYKLLFVSTMALHTAVNLFLLSIAIALLHPQLGIANLFTGNRIGNLMARRLFGLLVVMVILLGALRIQTQQFQLFSVEIGTSILVIGFLLSCLVIIGGTAKWMNRIDAQRSRAEEEVIKINALLGKRVEERSAALMHSLDKLQKSEEKYRTLIEQASDAIYIVDNNGYITEVNNSLTNLVGFSRDELLQMNVAELIDPEQLKADPLGYKKLLPYASKIRERKFRDKNWHIVEVEMSIKKLHDERMMVIARDITQRKAMEAELKKAEIKFRTLADRSMVGIYIIQKGLLTYVNPRFAQVFGYKPEELMQADVIEKIISEDHRPIVIENIRARLKGEVDSTHYTAIGKKKDGTTNWVEFYGNRVIFDGEPTIIGSMIDITERKEAEQLMIKEKNLADTIINSLPGIFYLKNTKGEFLRWNHNLETVTGCSYEQIKTANGLEFIAQEDQQQVAAAIARVFKDGYATAEANVVTTDSVKVPYLLTGSKIAYGNEACYLGVGIDIAQRLKAIEELRASEQKYKLLFEDSPLPMWMIAKNDLSIIAVNDVAVKLYGYTRDELLKMSVHDMHLKENMPQIITNYGIDLHDSRDMGTSKHLKKDGSTMDVQVIAHDIVFEGREVRLAYTNDVTENLKTQQEHQKSEANLITILNNTDTAYVLLDTGLKVLEFNNKAVLFTKKEFNFDLRKSIIYNPRSQKKLTGLLNNAKEVLKGNIINYQVNYPQPDGTNLWYHLRMLPVSNKKNQILGIMVAATDITERKKAEEDLRLAYEHIQTHVNSIKEMAWKQSHLIRGPLANLKGLMPLMQTEPDNHEILTYIQAELDRMDSVIIEMAQTDC